MLDHAKRFLTDTLLIGLISTITALSVHAAEQQTYQEEFIGIRIKHTDYGRLDYLPKSLDVLLDKKDEPLLDTQQFFNDFMEYPTTCKQQTCTVDMPGENKIVINGSKQSITITRGGKTKKLTATPAQLVYHNKHLYFDYRLIKPILNEQAIWNLKNFSLTIELVNPLPHVAKRIRKENNKRTLKRQLVEADKRKRLQSKTPLKPTNLFNLEGKYQVQANQYLKRRTDVANNQQLIYSLTSDVLSGTLQGSGTFKRPKPNNGQTYTWNYALRDRPWGSLMQIGDLTSQPSTFVGTTRLHNAIKYDRKQEVNPKFDFEYTDQTLPGTEINVWRGSYLVTVINVGASGQFTIVDPDAQPGDLFKLIYYFPDGTEATKYIRYSPNRFLLLNNHQWDLEFVHGSIDNGTNGSLGTYTHSLLRYGLFNQFTIGWGTYNIPLDNTNTSRKTLNYIDTAWQVLPSLAVDYDRLINTKGYALEGIWTYFQSNTVEAKYRRMDADNPLLEAPQASGDLSTPRLFTLKDIWNIWGGWRLVSQYENGITADEYQTDLTGSWSRTFSQGYRLSWIKNNDEPYQFTSTLNNTYRPSSNNQLSANFTWTKHTSNSQTFSYTYRSQGQGGQLWNTTISYNRSKTNGSGVNSDITGSLFYQFTPHLSSTLTVGEKSVLLSFNFTDVVGLFSNPQLPSHYAGGSVQGYVYAPAKKGEKPKPIAGAKVKVGGQSTVTDETGYYSLSGASALTRVDFSIDPSSIDLTYMPQQDKVPMYFRPGTVIEYNPVISHNISIDGYIFSDEDIPNSTEIAAIKQDKSGIVRYAKVEKDGFFIIERLMPGKYQLQLVGEPKNAPKPKTLVIEAGQDWISDVNLHWYQLGSTQAKEEQAT